MTAEQSPQILDMTWTAAAVQLSLASPKDRNESALGDMHHLFYKNACIPHCVTLLTQNDVSKAVSKCILVPD